MNINFSKYPVMDQILEDLKNQNVQFIYFQEINGEIAKYFVPKEKMIDGTIIEVEYKNNIYKLKKGTFGFVPDNSKRRVRD